MKASNTLTALTATLFALAGSPAEAQAIKANRGAIAMVTLHQPGYNNPVICRPDPSGKRMAYLPNGVPGGRVQPCHDVELKQLQQNWKVLVGSQHLRDGNRVSISGCAGTLKQSLDPSGNLENDCHNSEK